MKFALLTLLAAGLYAQTPAYKPLTGEERLAWFAKSTYGPKSLLISGPFTSAWRTKTNRPEEWGPHWDGFGRRYGMRLVNNSVTNGIEGVAGAAWGEDPRYPRLGDGNVGKRLKHALKMTVLSRFEDGNYRFGAAKAIGIAGGAFAQKGWMPDSVTSNRDCMMRIGGGYAGRLMGNLFREFLPDLRGKFKK